MRIEGVSGVATALMLGAALLASAPASAQASPARDTSHPRLTIQGTARMSDGSPAAGVYVAVPRSGLSATTDEEGRYTLDLPHAPNTRVSVEFSRLGLTRRSYPILPPAAGSVVVDAEMEAEAIALTTCYFGERPGLLRRIGRTIRSLF